MFSLIVAWNDKRQGSHFTNNFKNGLIFPFSLTVLFCRNFLNILIITKIKSWNDSFIFCSDGVDIESSGQFRHSFMGHKTKHLPTSMDWSGQNFPIMLVENNLQICSSRQGTCIEYYRVGKLNWQFFSLHVLILIIYPTMLKNDTLRSYQASCED